VVANGSHDQRHLPSRIIGIGVSAQKESRSSYRNIALPPFAIPFLYALLSKCWHDRRYVLLYRQTVGASPCHIFVGSDVARQVDRFLGYSLANNNSLVNPSQFIQRPTTAGDHRLTVASSSNGYRRVTPLLLSFRKPCITSHDGSCISRVIWRLR
jgi:hypothetical protein